MTGAPDTSTGARDRVRSRPAPAAVPELRRQSTLAVHAFQRRADRQRVNPERRRLTHALLLSLLIHALLLSLAFGGEGFGLPGFSFPWQDRRIEVPDLRVVVIPPRVTAAEPAVTPVAEPLQQARIEQPVTSAPAPTPSVSAAPAPRRTAAAIVPEANPTAEANPRTDAATGAAPVQTPLRADPPGGAAPPPIPAPAVIAVARTDEPTLVVPATPPIPTPAIATAPSATSPETAMPSLPDTGAAAPVLIDQEAREGAVEPARLDPSKQERQREAEHLEAARQDAAREEAARAENARREAERQEAARAEAARVEAARAEAARVEAAGVEAARVEAARVEAARVEAARVDAARVEAARAEAARAEAARVEAARVEAARVEAARVEAARVEAARVEAARVEAARVDAARVEAARVEAARVEAARQEAAARREETLRAIGRQLDAEADRREAASSARRYWLFGRTDANAEVILYVEAWSRKIQLNVTTFELVREAAKQPHTDPIVTVAVRSDGSVESVTFVRSSGVAAIDEAIRRVVDSQKPYQVFPPNLAREFDVILIRRSWHFDTAIRLQ